MVRYEARDVDHEMSASRGTTVCQLHMRLFKDGDELFREPWPHAFPVIKDLAVNRSAFERGSSRRADIFPPHMRKTDTSTCGQAICIRRR